MTSIQKPWGTSRPITTNDRFEIVEIHIAKGGYCSKHLHEFKSNTFIIISGRILVYEYFKESPVTGMRNTLRAGDSVSVPAGQKHRFHASEDAVVLEVYAASSGRVIDPLDIKRYDEGGIGDKIAGEVA